MNSNQPSPYPSVNKVSGHFLLSYCAEQLSHLSGPLDVVAYRARLPEGKCPNSLVFVRDKEALQKLVIEGPTILICSKRISESAPLKEHLNDSTLVLCATDFPVVFARVLGLFNFIGAQGSPEGIHPTAIVSPTAQVSPLARVGPFCVIGPRATIADGANLDAHVVVESDATIGARTWLRSFVVIGYRCKIGSDCLLHSHTTIGADGFGFYPSQNGAAKIPQIGIVEIGNHVELGANCAVDRATIDATRIADRVKIDNHVHVGHNTQIGSDSLIAGGAMFAGSSTIGARFMVGGGTLIADHVTIVDGVNLGGRSAVTQDILESGSYGGYPLQPLKKYLKNTVLSGQLDLLQNRIRALEDKLAEIGGTTSNDHGEKNHDS